MTIEKELAECCRQWDEAMTGNDADAVGRFMHDDWVIVGSNGITTKNDFLASVRSGDLTHHTMNSDEMKVKVHGDCGVVISRGTSAGHYKGQPFKLYEWSANTFTKQEGGWRCIATMLTPAIPTRENKDETVHQAFD